MKNQAKNLILAVVVISLLAVAASADVPTTSGTISKGYRISWPGPGNPYH